MQEHHLLSFEPFRLDVRNAQLWRGSEVIRLTSKALAVLCYLAERSGQLVTKDELFAAVWPEVVVSDAALVACIGELRRALGDARQTPQFIETVHGRGYRFIAPVTTAPPPVPGLRFNVQRSHSAVRIPPSAIGVVGRDAELAQLHRWWAKALAGERQIVFVSGEVGIGKTTVVEAFLDQIAAKGSLWIGRGQCIEHYGAGEGYMPVLEALGRLCRESEGARVTEFLHQHAPTWLVQMPALLGAAKREKLQREVAGATRERMLREMAEALEALTANRPLVLRLEDLHWSDVSTLGLLSVLARRQEAARLLVIGTYRPVEMLANGHPLRTVKQELQLHKQCEEQRLTFLTEDHVAEYLARRFAGGAHGHQKSRADAVPLQALARTVHQRTEGNPLFMVNVADYLAAQGGLGVSVESVQVGIPGDLRQMIEEQIHQLSAAERCVLEVASVAGVEFSAAAVAAGLGVAVEEVEERCAGLVRREQFLRVRQPAEWPDGTVASRYQFLHALYQEVFYERLPAARRSRLHRVLGERTEAAYGVQAKEIAAELAVHFERGRDYRRAVQYLQHAGENALRRSAYQEAINLLTKELELLKALPDTPERAQKELALQLALGDALLIVKGYTAPEVEKTILRTRELHQQGGETLQLFPVLLRLFTFYHNRGELQTTHELAEQLMRLAQSAQDPYLLSEAHQCLGTTLYVLGEFASARTHLERAIALYDPQQHPRSTFNTADPRVGSLSYASLTLWCLGYPDQALKRSQEALTLAAGLSHPLSLAFVLNFSAVLHQLRRERQACQEQAEAAISLATKQGFPFWLAWGTVMRGGALAVQGQVKEGIAQMQQGLAAYQAIGTETVRTGQLPMLAVAYAKVGRIEEGLSVLAEALDAVNKTGARMGEVGLYVLKGWLLLARSGENQAEVEACFRQAINIARRQGAKSWELRAVMSLARLWQQQGKKKQARKLLAEIYGWFTEGFDNKDLQEAKVLLEELARV